jgi:hypothetical protein
VLGLSTTRVLFGGDSLNDNYRSGARFTVGAWLDPADRAGIEVTYLRLGASDQSGDFRSTTTPILAIPFTSVFPTNGNPTFIGPTSVVVAYPSTGLTPGTVSVESVSKFDTLEVLLRRNIYEGCNAGMDFVLGYRYARLTDSLTLNANVEDGFEVTSDNFATDNMFNAVEFGVNGQFRRSAWTLDWVMKLGLGDTRSTTTINGVTTTPAPTKSGGIFALSSNIGNYTSNQFSVMPELGFTVGYDITSRLRATMGYSFIYWSQVHRAGEQIDTNLNPNLLPPATTFNYKTTGGASASLQGPQEPRVLNATDDFWAQGVNFGLEYVF